MSEHELFDLIPSEFFPSKLMPSWTAKLVVTKNVTSGVFSADLGEFSGSGSTKDEALKDLCEQLIEEIGEND